MATDWQLHGPNCICGRCRGARRKAARLAEGPRRVLVSSDVAAEHVATLRGAGWSLRKIADEAGVGLTVVHKAARPGRRIEPGTEERLLAVKLG